MEITTVSQEIHQDFREIDPQRESILPKWAMVIPILFWVILFSNLLAAFIIGRIGHGMVATSLELESKAGQYERDISVVDRQTDALNERIREADKLYDWVTTVPMVQPFLVDYFSSFGDDDRVSRIELEYMPGSSGQFSFQGIFQGQTTQIANLYSESVASVARSGWSMAQTERKIDGNTAIIKSLVRPETNKAWALFGLNEVQFNEAMASPPPEAIATRSPVRGENVREVEFSPEARAKLLELLENNSPKE